MRRDDLIRFLVEHRACDHGPDSAMTWIRENPTLSPSKLWRACPRGEWSAWLVDIVITDERRRTALACELARTAWEWMPRESRDALVFIEAWARGDASDDKRAEVARRARAAVRAALAAEAAYWAAKAVGTAETAKAAVRAALAAGEAEVAQAARVVRAAEAAHIEHARIVRKHFTWAEIEAAVHAAREGSNV